MKEDSKGRGLKLRVDELVRGFLAGHPSFSANPIGNWQELVGAQVARYSVPKSLKSKVLVVVVYDSVWKHHLDLHKDAIQEKINAGRREPLVEKIVLRIGEVPESVPVLNSNYHLLEKVGQKRYRPVKKKKTPLRRLTPEEKALLENLPDPDLRVLGARLLRKLPL